uniref:H/ACA ribonucleoprotein complex subunit 2-like protein n=2 Tax=Caligus rogercresseyi TaxID=217165 RepID=C1BMT4_CALRO|nr:H/ACA ribonucleoprotein complex subunit 2-like protein [Caligus rogercresseyi]
MGKKDESLLNTTNGSSAELTKEVYEEKMKHVSIISKPMASRKLTKKIYKCIKKGMKQKNYIRSGLKSVQLHIRKGERGLLVFAGDVTPIDVMCHLPAVAEDKDIPYCFTPSRADLGTAMGVKRGTLTLLIREHEDYQELFDEIKEEIHTLPIPTI